MATVGLVSISGSSVGTRPLPWSDRSGIRRDPSRCTLNDSMSRCCRSREVRIPMPILSDPKVCAIKRVTAHRLVDESISVNKHISYVGGTAPMSVLRLGMSQVFQFQCGS